MAAQPEATLGELRSRLLKDKQLGTSIGLLWGVLKKLGLRLKKTLRAAEQDSERVQRLRREFRETIAQSAAEDLIFLDESGVTTEMTRRYGRGPIGERVTDSAPGNWRTLTLLGAIGVQGWVALMTVEAPTDGNVFMA